MVKPRLIFSMHIAATEPFSQKIITFAWPVQASDLAMADDGMLMNVTIGVDSLGAKPVFKGGRWKDRLQAKKSLKRRTEKKDTIGTLTGSNAVPTQTREPISHDEFARPAKKQKLDGDAHSHTRSNNTTTKPKEVVSSLFTYNPTSKPTAPSRTQAEDVPVPPPSNAPLPASASPFTSLGLSLFLSTHLTQNLNLTAPTAIQKASITQLLHEDSDAFIQAETGSGKTLAYLLPILQRMIAMAKLKKDGRLDRTSGLFALILAPTRELTHQISSVLDRLLRPMPWLVAGTVTGGATKNHEKSRLRKGLNILVATPGRLADHLEHTEVLDVSNIRWLVLDEGDRLMELGFEEEIKGIAKKLEERQSRRKSGVEKVEGLPEKRTTVLCSATMKMGVQKLGEISLKDAVHIKPDPGAASETNGEKTTKGDEKEKAFLAPAQLKQSYIAVPPKQRLVTLAALLKRTFARKGSVMKAIVFLSCADSVDFHFEVFGRKGAQPAKETTSSDQNPKIHRSSRKSEAPDGSPATDIAPKPPPSKPRPDLPTVTPASTLSSSSNPALILYKLHGSLERKVRTATLQSFTSSPDPSILLCTDVASRGLDLPNIDLVIEYDPPFSADDHLHRVGRTARAGKEGRASCFLMPGPEEGYISVLKECAGEGLVKGEGAEDILRKGFAGTKDKDGTQTSRWNDKATHWQLDIERWVIDDARAGEMARKAFVSHVRAYATHVAKEREMFDVKGLHLGHLAKAFALRERPGSMGWGGNTAGNERPAKRSHGGQRRMAESGHSESNGQKRPGKLDLDLAPAEGQDAARKMRKKMREQMPGGAGEFNIG